MRILAIDPGGTSGLCLVNDDIITVIAQEQLGPHDHHSELVELLDEWKPHVVVYETWHHRARVQKDDAAKPVEYIGILKFWLQTTGMGCNWDYQESNIKDFWTNDKVKACGLWVPGKPHAMDATRHYLQYVTFTLKLDHYLKLLQPESPATQKSETQS